MASASRLSTDFKLKKSLGSGSFGIVVEAEHILEKRLYAIKLAKVDKTGEREIQNLVSIPPHSNVVHYVTCWKDKFSSADVATIINTLKITDHDILTFQDGVTALNMLCIQMELCHSNLRIWLKERTTLDKVIATDIFLQLAQGLKHIHDNSLIHRDLKPENIFLCSHNQEIVVKVGDLGLGAVHRKMCSELHTKQAGTMLYLAPEQNNQQYGKSVDIFALGIILMELFCPEIQSKSDNNFEWIQFMTAVMSVSANRQLPAALESNTKDVSKLVLSLTSMNPKDRPGYQIIFNAFGKSETSLQKKDDAKIIKDLTQQLQAFSFLNAPAGHLQLVQRLSASGKIKHPLVLETMSKVDRAKYVKLKPYDDSPQPIGCTVNISAPHMHAMMLEAISDVVKPGHNVLDIGAGSGYITACLALMVGPGGKIYGIEHMTDLAEKALENIKSDKPVLLDSGVVKIVVGDGRKGYTKMAPFDIIHIGAASETLPEIIFQQLKENGRIVAPIGDPSNQKLQTIDKINGKQVTRNLCAVRFALLTSQTEQLCR